MTAKPNSKFGQSVTAVVDVSHKLFIFFRVLLEPATSKFSKGTGWLKKLIFVLQWIFLHNREYYVSKLTNWRLQQNLNTHKIVIILLSNILWFSVTLMTSCKQIETSIPWLVPRMVVDVPIFSMLYTRRIFTHRILIYLHYALHENNR